jgi:hypothetical protein
MQPKADDGHGNETEYKANLSATVILIDLHFSNTKTALSIHFPNILGRIGDGIGLGQLVTIRHHSFAHHFPLSS